jgi:K+-transporting ATPase KdpF subunit
MHTESAIMLAVSALTMIYLFYALLKPEKF